MGVYVPNYLKDGGQLFPRIMTILLCYSPVAQLLNGLYFIEYRYSVFAVEDDSYDSSDGSVSVSPYGQYAAQIPLIILLA